MKTKIPFSPQLAMRAWQKPNEDGVSYELYTKAGLKVTPVDNTTIGTHPFHGRVSVFWNTDGYIDASWTADGYYFRKTAPMGLDLQLFKITNND